MQTHLNKQGMGEEERKETKQTKKAISIRRKQD